MSDNAVKIITNFYKVIKEKRKNVIDIILEIVFFMAQSD